MEGLDSGHTYTDGNIIPLSLEKMHSVAVESCVCIMREGRAAFRQDHMGDFLSQILYFLHHFLTHFHIKLFRVRVPW